MTMMGLHLVIKSRRTAGGHLMWVSQWSSRANVLTHCSIEMFPCTPQDQGTGHYTTPATILLDTLTVK